jgi:hypothetical protein
VAEIIDRRVYILKMHEMSFSVLPFGCACGERISDGCSLRDLVSAGCDLALGEPEVLGVVAQLVQFSDEQSHGGASMLRREIGAAQNAKVVINIGPGDVSVHSAPPLYA